MSKIATLIGCAIGDALGNPFEMKLANYKPLQEWDGSFKDGGTFWVGKAGQYTDDTLMSIALSLSLIDNQGFDPEKVAKEYLNWYNSGNTRGIGNTTAQACFNLKQGVSWDKSGLSFNHDGTPTGGNGTAMRAAPLGVVYRFDFEDCMKYAIADASITHNSLEPKMGSVAVALGTAFLVMRKYDPKKLVKELEYILQDSLVKDKLNKVSFHIENETDPFVALADIGTNGYVPETVGAAFYCLAKNDNFKDTVVMAVKAGGDTDTTAAIAGALAGTYYSLDGIPDEYKDNVENSELLLSLTESLIDI